MRYVLRIDWEGRPHTLNDERRMQGMALRAVHDRWRAAGAQASILAKVKPMRACRITAWTEYPKGTLPDTEAPAATLKCVLDGLVDRQMLKADTGEYVRSVEFLPALTVPGCRPRIVVVVDEIEEPVPDVIYPA